MKIGIVALTRGGRILAEKLVRRLEHADILNKEGKARVADTIARAWPHYDGIVCIMAAGIVVRAIAPLVRDKLTDPCVVVLDEKGRHVVSLLSGHVGGGNNLSRTIAAITGGTPVITTASDTLELVALDLWAREQEVSLPPRHLLTEISTRLVNHGRLKLYTDVEVASLPPGLERVDDVELAEIIISPSTKFPADTPCFRPRNLVVGIGCNRGTPVTEFEEALAELFYELCLSRQSIRNLASIDKKNDETGLLQFALDNKWSIEFFTREAINSLNNLEISFAALKAVGAIGVAEPTALLSAKSTVLRSRKRKWKNITMAVAQAPCTLSAQAPVQHST
jgi:cobalt-precorrin 5A hydrolase